MKYRLFFLLLLLGLGLQAQQLQLHYDFRHTLDPQRQRRNFPTLVFEYFTTNDTSSSFLLKLQTDFTGEKSQVGQVFLQVSQNLRYWKPPVYLSLQYSGGLGVAPPAFGYHLTNTFGAGLAYPFQWRDAWGSAALLYRHTTFARPSHDAQLTFYLGKGFFHYQLLIAASFVAYTENRDQGTAFTEGRRGKKVAFFGDPQLWWKVGGKFSVGTRVNLFYHVLDDGGGVQVYPTVGGKWAW